MAQTTYTGLNASGYARVQNGNQTTNFNLSYHEGDRKEDQALTREERSKALIQAAGEGQTSRVKYLVTQLGVYTEERDDQGLTALHHAVLSGFLDTVEMLLESGADVNAKSSNCGTPLHLAALKARSSVVSRLLKGRAKTHCTSRFLGSPMHCACYAGSVDIVHLLKEGGASVTSSAVVLPTLARSIHETGDVSLRITPGGFEESTMPNPWNCLLECLPCHLAIMAGHSELFVPGTLQSPFEDVSCQLWMGRIDLTSDRLIASPSRKSVFEMKTAMLAVAADQPAVLGMLLMLGMAADIQDEQGITPLMMAISYTHPHCVQCLLTHGADPKVSGDGDAWIYVANSNDEAIKQLVRDRMETSRQEQQYQIPMLQSVMISDQRSFKSDVSSARTTPQHHGRFKSLIHRLVPRSKSSKSGSRGSQSFVTAVERLNVDSVLTDQNSFKREYVHGEILSLLTWLDTQEVASFNIASGQKHRSETFIPRACIESHFKAERYRITRILIALFEISSPRDLDVTPRDISQGCCSRVFCILLVIGRAHLLRHFLDHNTLSDSHLPFHRRPEDFPELDMTFFTDFYDAQWRFFAPKMEQSANLYIEPKVVLPIIIIDRSTKQSGWTYHSLKIHSQHDGYAQNMWGPKKDAVYTVRTLHRKSGEESMGSSRSSFLEKLLRTYTGGPAMIRHYGTFTYRNTFNVITEYVDMQDMMTFFATHDPPSTAGAIRDFWKMSFGLIDAVNCMHHLLDMAKEAIKKWPLDRSHVKLSPSTILISYETSTKGYCFKLAETVFDVLKRSNPISGESSSATCHSSDAQFEAIEYPRIASNLPSDPATSGNKLDVWSLGCFFSIAAVWVGCGQAGLSSYSAERAACLKENQASSKFHDGSHRLAVVDQWHKTIQDHIPVDDSCTPALLKMVTESMLCALPEQRQSTSWLTQNASRITVRQAIRPSRLPLATQQWQYNKASESAKVHHGDVYGHHRPSRDAPSASLFSQPNGELSKSDNDSVHVYGEAPPKIPRVVDIQASLSMPPHEDVPYRPYLPLSRARSLYQRRRPDFLNRQFRDYMRGRDFILIVDDASSMKEHWSQVIELVEILVYLLTKSDPGRLELYLMSSSDPIFPKDAIETVAVLKKWDTKGATALDKILDPIAQRQNFRVEDFAGSDIRGETCRPFSLLVLTDGLLEAGHEKQGHDALRHLAELDQQTSGGLSVARVIRFGWDAIGASTFDAIRGFCNSNTILSRFLDVVRPYDNVLDMLLQKEGNDHTTP